MTSPRSRPLKAAQQAAQQAASPEPSGFAEVSYRLMREAAVKEARRNPLTREDFRDAHPMLLRAARSVGVPADGMCPLCDEERLVCVKYAFGPRLPAEGRCLENAAEEERLAHRVGVFTCRVVEVCCACAWNYLVRSYTVRGLEPAPRRARKARTSSSKTC